MNKRIIYIDMDDVLCNYSKAHTIQLAKNPNIKYPQSEEGFFKNLEPIVNGLESVNKLKESRLFEVYILTAPSIHNPLCYMEKRLWVENFLGMNWVERLIISSNKGLCKGAYLIDDHIEGRGQEFFEGVLIPFGSPQFSDWETTMSYFSKKYKL